MTLIVIGGATATGKSDLAVDLAERIGAQIVNADSMQLYRGMDIGTAKMTMEERRGVAHHMLDLIEVSTDANVSWYQGQARAKIDELLAESIPVIVVGGTGLYIKAILDDLNFPDTDPVVRAKLEVEAEHIGGDALHQRLGILDPAAAAAIPKENIRRVVRALEVIEITGKPFTANLPRENSTRYPKALQFGLEMDRDQLDLRVDLRVDRMFERGLVDEVDALIGQGILEARTARAALGYAQVIAMRAGDISEGDAITLTKLATRQYIRRQETWFRRDQRITWLEADSDRLGAIEKAILNA
ncbi:MAG: tRNA (adenosine(37)-N6)-dimethylallyltransferase MiaA [Actinomycetes bacterium]